MHMHFLTQTFTLDPHSELNQPENNQNLPNMLAHREPTQHSTERSCTGKLQSPSNIARTICTEALQAGFLPEGKLPL